MNIFDETKWPDDVLEDQRIKVWQYHRDAKRKYPLAAQRWADWAVRLEAETMRRFNAAASCQEAA